MYANRALKIDLRLLKLLGFNYHGVQGFKKTFSQTILFVIHNETSQLCSQKNIVN